MQPSFNQAIDNLLAYKWNGFFEQLALGMDGYDTELMVQSYQDQEPYDPHGYTREIRSRSGRWSTASTKISRDSNEPSNQRWTAK